MHEASVGLGLTLAVCAAAEAAEPFASFRPPEPVPAVRTRPPSSRATPRPPPPQLPREPRPPPNHSTCASATFATT